MFPDKPPPTGVRTPQHRRPHLHIHFLTGILPPSCTTPGGIIHIARFLNGAPWNCAVHSQHNCTWMPCTLSCGLASTHTHTHRVTDTWRYTLRFTTGLTHISRHTHPPGIAPHTDSPTLSAVHILMPSIDTLVHATPDGSYWDTPHSPPLLPAQHCNRVTNKQSYSHRYTLINHTNTTCSPQDRRSPRDTPPHTHTHTRSTGDTKSDTHTHTHTHTPQVYKRYKVR